MDNTFGNEMSGLSEEMLSVIPEIYDRLKTHYGDTGPRFQFYWKLYKQTRNLEDILRRIDEDAAHEFTAMLSEGEAEMPETTVRAALAVSGVEQQGWLDMLEQARLQILTWKWATFAAFCFGLGVIGAVWYYTSH